MNLEGIWFASLKARLGWPGRSPGTKLRIHSWELWIFRDGRVLALMPVWWAVAAIVFLTASGYVAGALWRLWRSSTEILDKPVGPALHSLPAGATLRAGVPGVVGSRARPARQIPTLSALARRATIGAPGGPSTLRSSHSQPTIRRSRVENSDPQPEVVGRPVTDQEKAEGIKPAERTVGTLAEENARLGEIAERIKQNAQAASDMVERQRAAELELAKEPIDAEGQPAAEQDPAPSPATE